MIHDEAVISALSMYPGEEAHVCSLMWWSQYRRMQDAPVCGADKPTEALTRCTPRPNSRAEVHVQAHPILVLELLARLLGSSLVGCLAPSHFSALFTVFIHSRPSPLADSYWFLCMMVPLASNSFAIFPPIFKWTLSSHCLVKLVFVLWAIMDDSVNGVSQSRRDTRATFIRLNMFSPPRALQLHGMTIGKQTTRSKQSAAKSSPNLY